MKIIDEELFFLAQWAANSAVCMSEHGMYGGDDWDVAMELLKRAYGFSRED